MNRNHITQRDCNPENVIRLQQLIATLERENVENRDTIVRLQGTSRALVEEKNVMQNRIQELEQQVSHLHTVTNIHLIQEIPSFNCDFR